MELVIDGLDKLRLHTYDGRKITDIRIEKRDGTRDASYVFTFPPIDNRLKGWDKELEVYLCKFPEGSGRYELFVMGLHGVTCIYLELKEVRDIKVFQTYMALVIDKAKKYWQSL